MTGNRPAVVLPPALPGPNTQDEGSGVRLMISPEPDTPGRARVVGSLSAESVHFLVEAVQGGLTVLDLSEVDHADDAAVRALADLWPRQCTVLGCPRWLELWLTRVRHATTESL